MGMAKGSGITFDDTFSSKEEYIDYLKYKYEVNTITENDRITTGDGK